MTNQCGIFVGRFNPFHNGHLQVIKQIIAMGDDLIVAIGSTQESHTFKNPFTAGERILMIHQSLIEANLPISKIIITLVPDIHRYSIWVKHLQSYCPPFTYAITNNELTKRLFIEAGVTVKPIGPFNRSELNGTKIRQLMFEGIQWKELVPPAVTIIIESIDGVNRIRSISNSNFVANK